jgi:glycosyltransferase involved in cell wall biosynthesis
LKSVLFLSYYFPPVGGAGTQRPTTFVRHLPQLGWEPIVVTGTGPADSRWTPRDDALLGAIPRELEVRRLPGPEPSGTSGVRDRLGRYVPLRTPWASWWIEGCVESAADLGREVDLIYAWMSPFESATAAVRIAKARRRPWVADLGDPWALDEMMVYPTRLHRRRALRQMGELLETAAAIVMSTPEAVRRVQEAFPRLRSKRIVAIANGFDGEDFAGPAPLRDDDSFRIVHTGYFHTELGLRHRHAGRLRRIAGGTASGVDFLTRSHVYLLQAIERLLQRDPALSQRLEVHLAGVLSPVDRDLAERSGVCKLHGYLSHRETVELVRSADLLFLPMQDLPMGTTASIVPGKTYEYLASGRPILAAVPDGDARALLEEAGTALLCRPADVECMATTLARELERRRHGEPTPPPKPELVARYERRELTRRLAAIFDECTHSALLRGRGEALRSPVGAAS